MAAEADSPVGNPSADVESRRQVLTSCIVDGGYTLVLFPVRVGLPLPYLDRDGLVRLIRLQAIEDPAWMVSFLRSIRESVYSLTDMVRTAAAEFVRARLAAGLHGYSRDAINAILRHPPDPGEMLDHWITEYGRALPKPVKRGVADAVCRLYDDHALRVYDGRDLSFRFGDVVELVHPTPRTTAQGDLFSYAISRRHGRLVPVPESLPETAADVAALQARAALWRAPLAERRAMCHDTELLRAANMPWESLAQWLDSPMDASMFEIAIPLMNHEALVRNLRKLDALGVSDRTAAEVADRIVAEFVENGEIFPLVASYRTVSSQRWYQPFAAAAQQITSSGPTLPGRTLIVLDRSPSMELRYGYRRWLSVGSLGTPGSVEPADLVATFGGIMALAAERPTLVVCGGLSREVPVDPDRGLLRLIEDIGGPIQYSNITRAVCQHYAGHDRVMVVSDERLHPSVDEVVPADVPIQQFDVRDRDIDPRQPTSTRATKAANIDGRNIDEIWDLVLPGRRGA